MVEDFEGCTILAKNMVLWMVEDFEGCTIPAKNMVFWIVDFAKKNYHYLIHLPEL